jgi:hypothetical protein
MVAEIREKLALIKEIKYRFRMEWLNQKILNEPEGKDQYHIQTSKRFTALENLDALIDISRAWETIREIIKISAKKSINFDGP